MTGLDFFLGALASFIANFFSALAGGGSGLFLLPALLFMGIPFRTALATHKIATVGLGLGASTRHWREKLVNPKFCLYLLAVGGPGVAIGSLIATRIPEDAARIALGVLILSLAAMSQRLTKQADAEDQLPARPFKWLIGSLVVFTIGALNGSLTSGTGLFFTFWLVFWFRKPFTQALSYTMFVCSLAYNLIGAIVLGTEVTVQWGFVSALIVGAIVGGYAGSSLSLIKGERFIQRVFLVSCVLIGLSLLYSGFN